MILVHPAYIDSAAGALQYGGPPPGVDPWQIQNQLLWNGPPAPGPMHIVGLPSPSPSPAPSSGSLLDSLKEKWDGLSTLGKVGVAGGGAVLAVLALSAFGGKKRR